MSTMQTAEERIRIVVLRAACELDCVLSSFGARDSLKYSLWYAIHHLNVSTEGEHSLRGSRPQFAGASTR